MNGENESQVTTRKRLRNGFALTARNRSYPWYSTRPYPGAGNVRDLVEQTGPPIIAANDAKSASRSDELVKEACGSRCATIQRVLQIMPLTPEGEVR